MHFEELWEKCEELHKEMGQSDNVSVLLEELSMKVSLYKAIDAKQEIPEEDRQKAKSRALGEILLTLTHMSLQDNINVFEALGVAFQYRSASFFNQKYQAT